jgi:hypothetical protein
MKAREHFFRGARLPSPVPEEEKEKLICKIRAGDREAAHLAILSHIYLSLNLVKNYKRSLGSRIRWDELLSAALEGLCHGVNKIKEEGLPHNNLTGYLIETMHRFISDHLEKFPMVRIPGRTKRYRRQIGKELRQPETRELTESIVESHFCDTRKKVSALEIEEILGKIIQSPTEKSIIDLRMLGYKDAEIAFQLGLSKTSIFLMRRELERRFVTIFGAF